MATRHNGFPFKLSSKGRLLRDEPLALVTSFNIGGPAEWLLIPGTVEDIRNGLFYAREQGMPWRIMGSGTNILVPDAGLPGLTIKFWRNFDAITIAGNTLSAQAGAEMLTVAMRAAEAGLAGLEWGCGIPGTVGGAVYMNAGVPDAEIKDVLAAATILNENGDIGEITPAELALSYRSSILQESNGIVLAADFTLRHCQPELVFTTMNQYLATRRIRQPIDLPNCGSVFRNPPGSHAGKLIEETGLKGLRVGGVKISEQHANFIVNFGNGTAADVLELVRMVRERVLESTGVELQLEMRELK